MRVTTLGGVGNCVPCGMGQARLRTRSSLRGGDDAKRVQSIVTMSIVAAGIGIAALVAWNFTAR